MHLYLILISWSLFIHEYNLIFNSFSSYVAIKMLTSLTGWMARLAVILILIVSPQSAQAIDYTNCISAEG